ncbi:MAG: ABC transporter permease [Acidobacteriota bacterium]|nr:ABC transporter permease [Acidobacteriota bacterium]
MKILAVIKHEYKKIVLKWTFLIGTFLLPALGLVFAFVPLLVFSIKGEPVKIIVIDPSGKIKPRLQQILSGESEVTSNEINRDKRKEAVDISVGEFVFVDYRFDEKNEEQIQRELRAKVSDGEVDAYLIIPRNFEDREANFQLFSRRAGDIVLNSAIRGALTKAVRAEKLLKAKISEKELENLIGEVNFSVKKIGEAGEEKEGTGNFWVGFVVALFIYMVLSIYGQTVLSAVIEEKETRIAEILFSSARPFELMMGKLVGVGLAGLTQVAIWVASAAFIILFSMPYLVAAGWRLPEISFAASISFLVYFLLGFFTYASIFALIGSMVTNIQEGGQFSFVPVMIMLLSFYFCFAILRDPNSSFSFWISIAPFSSPLAMPIRMTMETPPVWQVLFSILVNLLTVVGIVWVASRIYRIGMLMYGKRATLPEIWRWIKEG